MTLNIPLPSQLEESLRKQLGEGLEREAIKQLAIAWFNAGRISSRQVGQMLSLNLFQAHEFLKANGGESPMSIEDVEKDLETLRELQ